MRMIEMVKIRNQRTGGNRINKHGFKSLTEMGTVKGWRSVWVLGAGLIICKMGVQSMEKLEKNLQPFLGKI